MPHVIKSIIVCHFTKFQVKKCEPIQMGFFIRRLSTHIQTIRKAQCFAHDNCFKNIREALEKVGIDWEEELLDNRDQKNVPIRGLSKMESTFFHQDRFEILIDARGFRPEDIKCTLTARSVEVSAQKEDKLENAHKRMSLIRQYVLPKDTVPQNGQCCLSCDGLLLVTAPWLK